MSQRTPKYWDKPNAERFHHTDKDRAIEMILDECEGKFPETIEIVGYAPMRVSVSPNELLHDILSSLDEEFGDPEGDLFEPTAAMIQAAKKLAAVIEAEYAPWACEEVTRETINVAEWVAANRPGWAVHLSAEDSHQ